jgi:CRISPR-associated protein Cas6
MPYIDLAFRVMGTSLPVDHGYALYSAISRLVPSLHEARGIGVHPVRGHYGGDGHLHLSAFSRLTFRLPSDYVRPFLPLAGQVLDVDGHPLRLGVPEMRALHPAATLSARLVTIKGFLEIEPFLDAAQRQLQDMQVTADLRTRKRRTVRVKDKQIVGFEVTAHRVDAAGSLRLQERGIGGRRHMGCGVFVPVRQREP